MKKLMIAATVALAGIAANAALVKWTSTGLSDLGSAATCTTGKDLGKGGDVKMFVWEFAAADWAALDGKYTSAANIWADVQDGKLDIAKATTSKASGLTTPAPTANGASTWNVDDTVYGVILYLHDDDKAFTLDGSDAYMVNYGKGTATAAGGAAINLGKTFGGTMGGTSATAWTAVPEPTSGLLLLLGVAGLALRRRRA